ncbi:proteasome subunit beta [Pseudonocardia sp. MCCB 268]|nr:proteasome subunit beta [Pseudonocardia cytotoxica]
MRPEVLPPPCPRPRPARARRPAHPARHVIAFTWADGVLLAGDRRGHVRQPDRPEGPGQRSWRSTTRRPPGSPARSGTPCSCSKLFAAEVEQLPEGRGPRQPGRQIRRTVHDRAGEPGCGAAGFVALPLYASYDASDADPGRIVTFDPSGSVAQRSGYASIGSVPRSPRISLKKRRRPVLDRNGAIASLAVSRARDAADDDTATAGGPDPFAVPHRRDGHRGEGRGDRESSSDPRPTRCWPRGRHRPNG